MRDVTRSWIDYTNSRKQSLDEAKKIEAAAAPVPIYAVANRTTAMLPRLVAKPAEPVASVNYSVPLVRLKKLARAMGRSSLAYRDVGKKSFDYAYDDLVGED
jgi:hypothetical protein